MSSANARHHITGKVEQTEDSWGIMQENKQRRDAPGKKEDRGGMLKRKRDIFHRGSKSVTTSSSIAGIRRKRYKWDDIPLQFATGS